MTRLSPALSKREANGESETIAFSGYFAVTVGPRDSLIYFVPPGGPLYLHSQFLSETKHWVWLHSAVGIQLRRIME